MSVRIKALEQAIKTLDALGLNYAVEGFNGEILGNLEVAKKKTKADYAPKGTYKNVILPHIATMTVGDVAVIPAGAFDISTFQSRVAATANHLWGSGSYKTAVVGNTVEILRVQ